MSPIVSPLSGKPAGPPGTSPAPRDRRSPPAARCADRPTTPPCRRTCRPPASRPRRRRTAATPRRWSAHGWPASTVSRSEGASTRPLGAVLVTATLMLRSGSSGVTGGSLCSDIRIPVLTALSARHPALTVLGPEQAVDNDVAPVVDLVDEEAARHPEVMGAHQLFRPDRADVFEPQPVVVAGACAVRPRRRRGSCRRPRRPARGKPSASPSGSTPRRSRPAVRGCSWHDPTNPVRRRCCEWHRCPDTGRTEVDVADPR